MIRLGAKCKRCDGHYWNDDGRVFCPGCEARSNILTTVAIALATVVACLILYMVSK